MNETRTSDMTISTPNSLRTFKKIKDSHSVVTKSNALARAEIQTIDSVLFGRLLNIFIAQIKREDEDFHDYKIPMVELMSNTRGGQYYDSIEKQAEKWLDIKVTMQIDPYNIYKYVLFNKIHINRKDNTININIHRDLKPHLLQLKDHFTQFSLLEYLRLSTVRAQKLFELLSSWRNQEFFKIKIEDFHNIFDSEAYLRANFKEFRKKVLEIAHKEILQCTSLYFRWETETRGRGQKVIAVIFYFTELTEEEKAAQKIKEMSLLQKKSNKCYERHTLSENECTPKKKSQICEYCLERGRMSAK